MNIRHLILQLQLLLWKNFVLRKRKKIRLCVEIVWPLFLFIILLIVRFSRIFEQNNADCYFVERPLPSYGLLPFFRAFICELDYSCYNRSIDNNYDEAFYELIKKLNNNLNDLISISTSEVSTLLSELFMLNQAIRINSSQISSIQKRNITQFINLFSNNQTVKLIHHMCDLIDNRKLVNLCILNDTQIFDTINPVANNLVFLLKNINQAFKDLLLNSSFSKSICGSSNRNIFMIFENFINNSLSNTPKLSKSYETLPKNLDFCSTLKMQLNSTNEGKFIFGRISAFLYGKILYAPNKPVYNNIINRMNSTFVSIENFSKIFDKVDILRQQFIKIEDLISFGLSTQNLEMLTSVSSFIKNLLGCIDLDKFIGHENEEESVKAAMNRINNETFWALIVFEENLNGTTLPNKISYKIRHSAKESRNTFFTKTREFKYGPNNCIWCNVEFVNGFIYIQDLLEKSIIEERTNESYGFGITTQMTPYPCYVYDVFVDSISQTLPLLMTLAWIFTVSMTVKDIVYEKEKRLKEFMRVMGLTNGIHWLAWFITSFVIIMTICIFLSIILKYGRIVSKIDISVLIVFLCCFVLATITQCFLISVFFNRANLAAAAGGIIYFLLYLPYIVLTNFANVLEPYQIGLASLSSTVGFGYGCSLIASFELQGVGINWKNFYEVPISANNGVTMNFFCLILLFDSFLYMILAWYIETIYPGEYGRGLSLYFPFLPSYWCGNTKYCKKNNYKKSIDNVINEEYNNDPVILEPIDINCENKIGIKIDNLHKIYSRGKNHALKGLTLNFYENEITSFLGHNGAGKTTTMHLLTGLYSPTRGTAKINGFDLNTDIEEIRKSLGFVPQYNVLFEDMNVINHLWFYARLKGLSIQDTKIEMEKLIVDTGLQKKRFEIAKTLSGGMQRKLSVAIAFVGGSKTVILDEPSAGVDPKGRRDIWDLLQRYRHGRTIVISTHHIDEADVLGDRIAMIANGKLIAHATSFFLKNMFGRGYYLTISKKKDADSCSNSKAKERNQNSFELSSNESSMDTIEVELIEVEQHILKTSNVNEEINLFIKSRIKKAILVKNNISEMVYSISNKSEDTQHYGEIFNEIESNMEILQIDSIGLSDTSLEEIFIRMAKQAEKPKEKTCLIASCCCEEDVIKKCISCLKIKNNDYKFKESKNSDFEYVCKYTNRRVGNKCQMLFQQLYSLMIKRFLRVRRNARGFVAEIVLPIIFVCLALLVASLRPKTRDMPALELNPWLFSEKNYIFYRKFFNFDYEAINLPLIENITNTFYEQPSIGNRCLKNHKIKVTDYNYYSISSEVTKVLECNKHGFTVSKNKTLPDSLEQSLNAVNYSYTKIAPVCSCKSGFPNCPIGSEGDVYYNHVSVLITNDTLIDLTERNISDWLIKTEMSEKYFQKRYGGFDFSNNREKNHINNQINNIFATLTNSYSPNSDTNKVKIWYNNFGVFAHTSFLNTLNNAILRNKLRSKENVDISEVGIISINHPLPYTKNELTQEKDLSQGNDIFVAICILFALSFIPASFLIFVVDERASNSKQLQFVSGIKPYMYWLANFIWDLLNYVVPCFICIILFIFFDVKAYTCQNNFIPLICLLLIYGWAAITFVYPFNYLFKLPSTAFVQISCLNIFIGVCTTISTAVIDQLSVNSPDLARINDIMKTLFLIIMPQYCLCRGILDLSIQYYVKVKQEELLGIIVTYSAFEFDIIGRNLIALFVQGIVFFLFNLLIEYKFFIRCKTSYVSSTSVEELGDEDDDVRAERIRIINLKNNEPNSKSNGKDYLKLINLTKVYSKVNGFKSKRHIAVKSLYLGIDKSECFGLIGVNGAGKTTTFKMLTGSMSISEGDAYLDGNSVSKDIKKVHQDIGYCPQSDAIFPLLTAREHLLFYARVRGIPEKYTNRVCKWALKRVGLEVFENSISGDFSGGNKRKLSTAIALVGNPSCIYLDEPTTGMDAKVRRLLWNDISNLIKDNRIVILTSHSMEECEALCTRLVIMVNGKFKCLGSPQHLKSKFGTGYKVSLRLDKHNDQNRNKLQAFMKANFPEQLWTSCINKRLFEFTVPFQKTKLSMLFKFIEENRYTLGLLDYSVTQSTLDSIFVNFAYQQNDDNIFDDKPIRRTVEDDEIGFQSDQVIDVESVSTAITYL